MSPTLKSLGIDRLTPQERLKLIGDIWDSLTPSDQSEITQSHKDELDRRLAAADADPSPGLPWQEVLTELQQTGKPSQ